MRHVLAPILYASPLCPILGLDASDDPTKGWGQFGLLAFLLFAAIRVIYRFMEHSLEQQRKQTEATIAQQVAQTEVLKSISGQISDQRVATVTLDARITKHMIEDEKTTQELVRVLRRLPGYREPE